MTSVAHRLRAEIADSGPISFARFMAIALYCPETGYYERFPHRLGREGDYYTSVAVGTLFGALLAARFRSWAKADGFQCLDLVEAGAHDGRLAEDLLSAWAGGDPARLEGLTYWIVEPSARRQAWQGERLSAFGEHVRWVTSLEALPLASVRGILFCNELLDAFPFHRLGWDVREQAWFEWGVDWRDEAFAWVRLSGGRGGGRSLAELVAELPCISQELAAVLPEGFTTEVCPTARVWWREAAARLARGRLMTIDYGLNAEDFLHPSRMDGTVRGYRLHRQTRDLLEHPGEQDLTAHVNFTAIRQAGETAGLMTEEETTQGRFLTRIAAGLEPATLADPKLVRQFQTLTHPDYLGRAFRVLVQARRSPG